MSEKDHRINDLLASRWSPRSFNAYKPLSPEIFWQLIEAARWAPSASNEQPWRFIAGINFNKSHEMILSTLTLGNQDWAKNAPLLLIAVAKLEKDAKPNRHSFHDVGAALQNLNLEATSLGMHAHLMAGFLPKKVRDLFRVPNEFEPITAVAVGYYDHLRPSDDRFKVRDQEKRERIKGIKLVFSEQWGSSFSSGE
jgi:nitroreductase